MTHLFHKYLNKYYFLCSRKALAAAAAANAPTQTPSKFSRVLSLTQFRVPGVSSNTVAAAVTPEDVPSVSTGARPSSPESISQKGKKGEAEENISRANTEVRDAIRSLLRMIDTRDNIQIASRRAYRALNEDCKSSIRDVLRGVVHREKEALAAREQCLLKLEEAVERIDITKDIDEFAERYAREDDTLMLYSQALSLIGDISEEQVKGIRSWSPTEADANDVAAVVAAAQSSSLKTTPGVVALSSSKEDASDETLPVAIADALATPMADDSVEDKNMLDAAVTDDINLSNSREKSTEAAPAVQLTAESAYTMFHKIFYLPVPVTAEDEESLNKSTGLNCPVGVEDYGTNLCSSEISALQSASVSKSGRTILVLVLNQFRSKKVEVGPGWTALGKVLWSLLENCHRDNDVHNAKIVMMLSQVIESLFLFIHK